MSTNSKRTAREKRLMQKRARKASNKAMYEKWKQDGTNSKSFRARKKVKGEVNNKGKHLVTNCGNPACKKCFVRTKTGVYQK